MFAWMVALLLHLQPVDFLPLNLTLTEKIIFRLLASFCGVFGFSIMFNSPRQLAAAAAVIGAIANTFRLELVDLLGTPSAAAAFLGALTAGLLASLLKNPCRLSKDCDHPFHLSLSWFPDYTCTVRSIISASCLWMHRPPGLPLRSLSLYACLSD